MRKDVARGLSRTLTTGLLLCLLTTCGCRTPGPPESDSFERVWSASLKAAADSGFRVVHQDEAVGVITARRAARDRHGEMLRVYVQPSQGGYSVAAYIRAIPSAADDFVGPPRTRRQESFGRSGRFARADSAGPSRHFAEEQRLLDNIRARLVVGKQRRESPR